jgi:ankyrin repeat protein
MKRIDADKSYFARIRVVAGISFAIILFAGPCAADRVEDFFKAAAQGDVDELKLLIEHGADVNAKRPQEGSTVLMIACKQGNVRLVDLLLKKGADVNSANVNGWTALMAAAADGHTEIVRLLLAHGADVNAKHAYGWTALKLASQKNHEPVRKLLLRHGAKK